MSVVSNELRERAISELEALARAVDGPVMVWSDEVLVLTGAAADAVRFYRSRGDVIVGLEGFDTDGEHRTPRMDCIADFSFDALGPDAVDRAAEAAFSVLAEWVPLPQLVTFVVESHGQDRL